MKHEKDSYHWIMYHLVAMEYARKKFEKEISKLPSGQKLSKTKPEELRKVVYQLKRILSEYEKKIEYHKEKAVSHIPEDEKTKRKEIMRKLENESYERIFLNKNDSALDLDDKNGFKTANTIERD